LLVFCVESRGPAEDWTLPFEGREVPDIHSDTPVPNRLVVTPNTEKSIVLSQKAPCSITLGKEPGPLDGHFRPKWEIVAEAPVKPQDICVLVGWLQSQPDSSGNAKR
jgi:hypothetical protein